ncbi:PaaI family thioesterase [Caulobacter sp. RHG1]|uniref:PaaI family thioesterase n=1 Tax=Caulobacter sp. (strain RHG1) TaxID=2545762 RepID=UPI0015525197|nr:PaaI family thioesterase [Caulobacter sp. RHG1]NQE60467.1 Thioesterase [Caulobacter sp. RHG1]
MDGGNEISSGPRLVDGGEWAGWRTWSGLDPFEDQSGPFYFREDDAGVVTTAFRAETKHMNGGGFMHGGCMMTFADFSLFAIAWKELADSRAVTVSLNGEFVGPARPGDLVTATGEVVRAGGSLLFVRGLISTGGSPMLNFSGVVKKIRSR